MRSQVHFRHAGSVSGLRHAGSVSHWVVALGLLFAGCHVESPQPRPSNTTQQNPKGNEQEAEKKSPPARSPNGAASTAAKAKIDELLKAAGLAENPPGTLVANRWSVNTIDGRWAGWSHLVETVESTDDGKRLHTQIETELLIRREGQEQSQRMIIHSTADESGDMIQSRVAISGDAAGTVMNVTASEGAWRAEATTAGQTVQLPIPITGPALDGFAPERGLMKQPLSPGESLTIKHFVPPANQLGETRFVAGDWEDVPLPTGSEKLLRVETKLVLASSTQEMVSWCDAGGKVIKTRIPGLKMETIETAPEIALAKPEGDLYDLVTATAVKVDRDLSETQVARRLVVKAKLRSSKIAGVFVEDASQKVEVLGDHEARLTIERVRVDDPAAPTDEKATEADLQAGPLIQADDRDIQSLARTILPDETDAAKIAVASELAVRKWIVHRDYSQAFASASDVMKSQTGDCTEHAVLLAAICRARSIPARVAAGLVYHPPAKGFAFHMWNEVWIDNRWVPLDAISARGGTGVDRIKLLVSNLNDVDAMAAMLPIVNVIGQLELEVESVER